MFQSKDPMTNAVLWEGKAASEKEIDATIQSAKKAAKSWSKLSLAKREEILLNFEKVLHRNGERFAETISKETGKPLWESQSEVLAMRTKISISIEAQKKRCPSTSKNLATQTAYTRHKPVGVLAVFGPFNFPGHLPNGHIVPALLAGNTVVFKPSELTPLVAEEMVNLWKQALLPDGVLNLIQGGAETGKVVTEHPEIDGLLFTGSWKTGKVIATAFQSHPEKILALEMGGNNPLLIGNIKDLKAASYLIIKSAFLTAGQRCSSARRLIIQDNKLGNSLLQTLLVMMSRVKIGAYTERPEPFMGPVINQHAANSLLTVQAAMETMGAKVLLKMERLQPDTSLVSPAMIDVTHMKKRPDEEYFGPLLQVIRVKSFAKGIEEANRTEFGLAASIFTDDPDEWRAFYQNCRVGILNWNAATTGARSDMPFGGVGKSGNFRPSAFYAADYCNYPVASIEADQLKMPEKIAKGIDLQLEGR